MKTEDINRLIQQTEENLKKQKEEKTDNLENFENLLRAPKKIYEINRVSKSHFEDGKNT
jgi:formylmethanofuran dehydrogenase subunit E